MDLVPKDSAVSFADLVDADLVLDRVYVGGKAGNPGDDPIAKLVAFGNQGGGFGSRAVRAEELFGLVVLYASGVEVDWPDHIDPWPRTRRSNVIARIRRALGIPPAMSANPTAVASLLRVMPVMSGSVPRKRAQAAFDEEATAPEPPPIADAVNSTSFGA